MRTQEDLVVKTGGFSTDPGVSCSVALIVQKTGANTRISRLSSELDIDMCTQLTLRVEAADFDPKNSWILDRFEGQLQNGTY